MIAIIDYGMGNIGSVQKALDKLGYQSRLTSDHQEIRGADGIILPGVGAFGQAMQNLESYGLTEILKERAGSGVPFLGICLGLQILFDSSEEAPGVKGLSIVPGRVVRFKPGLKVPHMGWNELEIRNRHGMFADVVDGTMVYFVHSYYAVPDNPEDIAAVSDYGLTFAAAVTCGNLSATQFHPEKSGDKGLAMLDAFAGSCR